MSIPVRPGWTKQFIGYKVLRPGADTTWTRDTRTGERHATPPAPPDAPKLPERGPQASSEQQPKKGGPLGALRKSLRGKLTLLGFLLVFQVGALQWHLCRSGGAPHCVSAQER